MTVPPALPLLTDLFRRYTTPIVTSAIWVCVLIFLALGFGFQTPNAKFQLLQAQMNANHDSVEKELAFLRQDRWELMHMMQFSVRYTCSQMSPVDQYRLGGVDLCAAAAHDGGRP